MKKVITLIVTLSLMLTITAPAFATTASEEFSGVTISDYLTEEDKEFFKKLETIFPAFRLDDDNNLYLTVSYEELAAQYGFTTTDIDRVDTMLSIKKIPYESLENVPMPYVHVEDWKIYFDAADVHALFFSASQVGPAAIVAAFTALASVYPVVGTIVGLFGGTFIVYWVMEAIVNEKGLYIGIDWGEPIPIPTPAIGLWG